MTLKVRSLSSTIGAEIIGMDPREPLNQNSVKFLRKVWLEFGVVFIRGYQLTDAQHASLCSNLGEIQAERTAPESESESHPGMLFVSNFKENAILPGGEMWFHSDQCYYEMPCRASTLYAMEIPSVGGNTLFANCYKAWEMLPSDLQEKLQPLKAHNIYDYESNPLKRGDNIDPNAPQYSHPVARLHPKTGKYALYVNRLMTDYIEGMDPEESDDVLQQLFEHSEKSEFTYEHVWRVGDLMIWDNRCAMHARTDFDPDERRMMRRITIKGEAVR